MVAVRYHPQGFFRMSSGGTEWVKLPNERPNGYATRATAIRHAKRAGDQYGVQVRVIVAPVKYVVWTGGRHMADLDANARIKRE
jgi:hypothetical protein